MLEIGGLVPLSTTDMPERLSAVVFLQGCPWKCVYCHNPGLQARPGAHAMPWTSVLDFLDRRAGLLDAVVFSGGEPTLQASLARCMDEVKRRGFKVGLHTAGIYPRRLASVLPKLEWVGLDIKARFSDYPRIVGRHSGASGARESLNMVLESGVEHEVRTTYHPALFGEDVLLELAGQLARRGVRHYALQLYSAAGARACALAPSPPAPGQSTLAQLRGLFETFTLRRSGEGQCA